MAPTLVEAKIIQKEFFPPRFFLLELEAGDAFLPAVPGQFVMIRAAAGTSSPLLRRPISIHEIVERHFVRGIRLLIELAGPGTAFICSVPVGQSLSILGPLGNGFPTPEGMQHAVLLAGGMGIAPMLFLARHLKKTGVHSTLLYGTRTMEEMIPLEPFRQTGIEIQTISEDGSSGRAGLAADLLPEHLREPRTILYACGPRGMLKTAKAIAQEADIQCCFSFEEYMACGFGVCLGCSIERSRQPGTYVLACKDGPVLDPFEVNFE